MYMSKIVLFCRFVYRASHIDPSQFEIRGESSAIIRIDHDLLSESNLMTILKDSLEDSVRKDVSNIKNILGIDILSMTNLGMI